MNKSLWKNIIIEYNENKNLLYQQFLLMKSIQSGMGDEVARCIIELHKNGCNGSDDVRLRLPHMVEESNGIHPSPDSNPDDVRLRNPTTRVSGFQPSDVRLTSSAPGCLPYMVEDDSKNLIKNIKKHAYNLKNTLLYIKASDLLYKIMDILESLCRLKSDNINDYKNIELLFTYLNQLIIDEL